jgi:hypothetical protein
VIDPRGPPRQFLVDNVRRVDTIVHGVECNSSGHWRDLQSRYELVAQCARYRVPQSTNGSGRLRPVTWLDSDPVD